MSILRRRKPIEVTIAGGAIVRCELTGPVRRALLQNVDLQRLDGTPIEQCAEGEKLFPLVAAAGGIVGAERDGESESYTPEKAIELDDDLDADEKLLIVAALIRATFDTPLAQAARELGEEGDPTERPSPTG